MENISTNALLNRALGMKQSRGKKGFEYWFEKWAGTFTRATGLSTTFLLAVLVIVVWAVTAPFVHYSDTWQPAINTGTTIISFLMVFIIQQSQNKDSLAIQLKLTELMPPKSGPATG